MWRNRFFYEYPEDGGGAPPAPGTGEAAPGVPTDTSATTENIGEAGTPPGPIPYTRFKEVNDARRQLEERIQPFAALEDFGYGADDLQRLVAWEQEYTQDPVGTWLRQANEIDGLPPSVKSAIEAEVASKGNLPADGSPPTATEDDQSTDGEPPEWAKPLLSDYESRQSEAEAAAVSQFYDAIVSAWKEIDDKAGMKTPDAAMHAHIASASVSATSAEELLRNARESYIAVRDELLSSEIKLPGQDGSTVPRSVPGGGGSGAGMAPPPRPRTLREATRMAQADAERGLLVPRQ